MIIEIKTFIISLLIIIFVLSFFVMISKILSIKKEIEKLEKESISNFFWKINKIPALIEIMKKYTRYSDIFEEIIYLHKLAIIYNIKDIYDILDLNLKIHREYVFLMKISAKIPEIHKDWNFLYIRDYVIFYEKELSKEIEKINYMIWKYNNLRRIKNYFIIWFLVPFEEKIEF